MPDQQKALFLFSVFQKIATPERGQIVLNVLPFLYGAGLVMKYLGHTYRSAEHGTVLVNDFFCFWLGAKAAFERGPAIVYDNQAFFEYGGSFFRELGFLHFMYPPTFLLMVYPLAWVSNPVAFLVFFGVTLAAYLYVGKLVWGGWKGALILAAMPTTLFVIYHGQNGFLLAALFGGAMAALHSKRFVLAGVLIGCLTIKPQIGLLIPLALIAGRYWTTFGTAVLSSVALAVLSWIAFGTDTWMAFFNQTFVAGGIVAEDHLPIQWHVTPFTMLLQFGVANPVAMALQAGVSVGVLFLTCWAWRQSVSVNLKAAVLLSAAMLATPYLLSYDMVFLSVAVLFYLAHMRETGLTGIQTAGLVLVVAVSGLSKIISINFGVPVGPLGPAVMLYLSLVQIRKPGRVRSAPGARETAAA